MLSNVNNGKIKFDQSERQAVRNRSLALISQHILSLPESKLLNLQPEESISEQKKSLGLLSGLVASTSAT